MEDKIMQSNKKYKTMSLSLAVTLMAVIAIAGAVAFYIQLNNKKELLAASQQAMMDQQNHVLAVYDQIETNLASIREHEGMIAEGFANPENGSNLLPEERIQNEIDYIKNLIDENNKLIASLNDQIDSKNSRIAGYERTVKDLQTRVTQYQEQLNQLVAEKEALQQDLDNTILDRNNLAEKVDVLGNEVAMKNSILDEKNRQMIETENTLHTAYYRVGTAKTLKELEIIQKEGGFLGINRVKSLTENPDAELFTKIDTRQVTRIPIDAKRWEIVTDQDPSSYEMEFENNNAEWLVITNPEKFWSKSKYLVIVVRDENDDELASR